MNKGIFVLNLLGLVFSFQGYTTIPPDTSKFVAWKEDKFRNSSEIFVVQTAKNTEDRLTPKQPIYFSKEDFFSLESVIVNTNVTYQNIYGFGGAFTEASSYVYAQLNETLKQQVNCSLVSSLIFSF